MCILSGEGRSRQRNSVDRSLISRYSPCSQRARNVRDRTQLHLRSQTTFHSACIPGRCQRNCRKFHIDNFFCDRHTIVAAASQFAVTREFVERAAHAARAGELALKPVSHRITLARVSTSGISPNVLTVHRYCLDRKRGVYRDNVATSFSCISHRNRLGNFCP